MKKLITTMCLRRCLFWGVFYLICVSQVYADNLDVVISATRGTLDTTVVVEWEPVGYATGYHVLKSNNYDGPYVIVGWADNGEEAYTDTNVEGGKYYWYRVAPLYLVISGTPTRRVQGWIKPQMAGGLVDTAERLPSILGQVPHFYNVRGLAEKRRETLPIPKTDDLYIPDNNKIYGWVENICATDHRRIGSPESKQAIGYIKKTLNTMPGIDVHDDTIDLEAVYNAKNWGVEIETADGPVALDAFYTVNTGMTLENPSGGSVTGEMVWAGAGSSEEFEALGDISGKVVVANCEFSDLPIGLLTLLFDDGYYGSDPEGWMGLLQSVPMTFARSNFPAEYHNERYSDSVYWQAVDGDAAGLILVMKNHPGDTNTHWGPYDGRMRPIPGFWVSSYKEEEIKALAQSGIEATLTLTGDVSPGEGHNIYATLPGKSDEIILISSHHDSCHKGATEDGTGVSMVLAQADIWSRVPMDQREKTIVFVLTDGHHYRGIGGETFSKEHMDDIMKKTIININLEHLAAKDVEDKGDGQLELTGSGALTAIFVNESPTAIATAARMLDNMIPKLDRTIEIHSTLLGDVPPGEAGHFHINAGTDFIHWIGYPTYLLTAEDTLDKVDKDLLNPIAKSVAEMVETFMMLPEGYSDYE